MIDLLGRTHGYQRARSCTALDPLLFRLHPSTQDPAILLQRAVHKPSGTLPSLPGTSPTANLQHPPLQKKVLGVMTHPQRKRQRSLVGAGSPRRASLRVITLTDLSANVCGCHGDSILPCPPWTLGRPHLAKPLPGGLQVIDVLRGTHPVGTGPLIGCSVGDMQMVSM